MASSIERLRNSVYKITQNKVNINQVGLVSYYWKKKLPKNFSRKRRVTKVAVSSVYILKWNKCLLSLRAILHNLLFN